METKITSYKVKDENGNGYLCFVDKGEEKEYPLGFIGNLNSKEIEELAIQFLLNNGIKVVSHEELIEYERNNYLIEQRNDLSFVRKKMKDIIRALTDKSTTLSSKNEMLGVAREICNASTILVKTCALELAFSKNAPKEIE